MAKTKTDTDTPPTSSLPTATDGIALALEIVDKHIARLVNGKELDLTAARAMRDEIAALVVLGPTPATVAVPTPSTEVP